MIMMMNVIVYALLFNNELVCYPCVLSHNYALPVHACVLVKLVLINQQRSFSETENAEMLTQSAISSSRNATIHLRRHCF